MGNEGVLTHVPQPLRAPFGSATPAEHQVIRAIDVGGSRDPPPGTAFMDGIQRYAVVGRFGVIPVVRGYVAAAVMTRQQDTLAVGVHQSEELIVAPLDRLSGRQLDQVRQTGIPLYDSGETDRDHPILDVHLAAAVVERRREETEARVARQYLQSGGEEWLVVDGPISQLIEYARAERLLGLVKSHETQFLQGRELITALTLPVGYRTSVFVRNSRVREDVHTWYLRLWPWEEHDLLHGLIRLERAPVEEPGPDATEISGWMLSERAPLSAPDGRWDRLIYPIRQVEAYLRTQLGGWL
ncbi:MAG: hypothetical protein P8X82_15585 [Gemmatimonadales bacterium]